jgi:hypothetical protein
MFTGFNWFMIGQMVGCDEYDGFFIRNVQNLGL